MAKDKKTSSGGASGSEGRARQPASRSIESLSEGERDSLFPGITDANEKAYLTSLYESQNLTTEQAQAVARYKARDYIPINRLLRGDGPVTTAQAVSADKDIDILDTITGRAPEPMTLYRGFGANNPASTALYRQMLEAHNKGDVQGIEFMDRGYASTSTNQNIAFGGELLFKIRVPAQTRIITPNRNGPSGTEQEVIVSRNTRYRALSSRMTVNEYGTERLTVELEAIQDE